MPTPVHPVTEMQTGQPGVPVLLYHSVSPSRADGDDPWQVTLADFKQHMALVAASGRTPLTASGYARWLRGDTDLPQRPIVVTFDDGFSDFADAALPVLDDLGIAATLFVTTGWVGRPGMLSPAALAELATVPSVELGAHSVSHPHVDVLGYERAAVEIGDCRRWLQDRIGSSVDSYAYPHGSHSARTRRLVVAAGYRSAYAVKNALSHAADDPFAVARYTVHAGTTRAQVEAVVAGHGAPLGWRRERLRTRGFRVVRSVRSRAAAWR